MIKAIWQLILSSDTQLGLIILFHTIPKYSHLQPWAIPSIGFLNICALCLMLWFHNSCAHGCTSHMVCVTRCINQFRRVIVTGIQLLSSLVLFTKFNVLHMHQSSSLLLESLLNPLVSKGIKFLGLNFSFQFFKKYLRHQFFGIVVFGGKFYPNSTSKQIQQFLFHS